MTLTQKDKHILRGLLKELKQEIKEEIKQNTTILQIYIDVKLKKMDAKLDQIARTTEESKLNVIKAGQFLEDHERRIVALERI